MRCKVRKPFRAFPVWFIVIGSLSSASLQAQDQKPQKRFFLGAGIGLCDVVRFRPFVNELGPSLSGLIGIHLSRKASLLLEYTILHPNDEKPRISDILVTMPENSQDGHATFTFVRYPKVVRTRVVILSYQRQIARDLYVRAGLGLGSNDSSAYLVSNDTVVEAYVSPDTGYAMGFAAGYRRFLSDRLILAIEATVRVSTGEDSTSARWVFGLGTALTWDF